MTEEKDTKVKRLLLLEEKKHRLEEEIDDLKSFLEGFK